MNSFSPCQKTAMKAKTPANLYGKPTAIQSIKDVKTAFSLDVSDTAWVKIDCGGFGFPCECHIRT